MRAEVDSVKIRDHNLKPSALPQLEIYFELGLASPRLVALTIGVGEIGLAKIGSPPELCLVQNVAVPASNASSVSGGVV